MMAGGTWSAAVRGAGDVGVCPVGVDRQPTVRGGSHGDSRSVEDRLQRMRYGSARDQERDWRGIRDGDAKISEHGRHGGTGRQDGSIRPKSSPSPVTTPATEPAWVRTVHFPASVTSRPPRP